MESQQKFNERLFPISKTLGIRYALSCFLLYPFRVLYVNNVLRSHEEWNNMKDKSILRGFKEISNKSGGLRAGLYRGFLPYFVINMIRDTIIEIGEE